jgi:hypothetical protein
MVCTMAKRLSISLEPDDERVLRAFAAPGTPERAALLEWVDRHDLDTPRAGSEAALVRVLLKAGAEAVQHHLLDIGYTSLAVELADVDHAEVLEARRRYADRTDRVAL